MVYLFLNNVAYHQILTKNYPIKKNSRSSGLCVPDTTCQWCPGATSPHRPPSRPSRPSRPPAPINGRPSTIIGCPGGSLTAIFIRNDDECWEFLIKNTLKCSGLGGYQLHSYQILPVCKRRPVWWSKAEKIRGFHFYEEVEFVKWCLLHAMSWIQTHRDIRY